MKVGFQGELGAYSEEAIVRYFGSNITAVPRPYLRDVFDAVENRNVDLGMVPAENSLEGSVVCRILCAWMIDSRNKELERPVVSPVNDDTKPCGLK